MKMKDMNANRLLGAIIALTTILGSSVVEAQTYPARPIQVIVPFAGGSASDVVTRILLERAAKSIGQPFIIDNRPGAGGNTGTLARYNISRNDRTRRKISSRSRWSEFFRS